MRGGFREVRRGFASGRSFSWLLRRIFRLLRRWRLPRFLVLLLRPESGECPRPRRFLPDIFCAWFRESESCRRLLPLPTPGLVGRVLFFCDQRRLSRARRALYFSRNFLLRSVDSG